jgi:hypothetical protein
MSSLLRYFESANCGMTIGQVAVHAARPVVRRVHARARGRFIHVHQVLALAERVQEHRHRADVEPVRAQPQQMVHQPRDLVEHHADVLRAHRHFDPEQLLDRHHIRVLVAHHRHVVEPVHVRHRLQVSARLGELLGRAVQQPDVRVGALNHLAVELEHQPQHTMRRRVLRAKIERVILDFSHYVSGQKWKPTFVRPVSKKSLAEPADCLMATAANGARQGCSMRSPESCLILRRCRLVTVLDPPASDIAVTSPCDEKNRLAPPAIFSNQAAQK